MTHKTNGYKHKIRIQNAGGQRWTKVHCNSHLLLHQSAVLKKIIRACSWGHLTYQTPVSGCVLSKHYHEACGACRIRNHFIDFIVGSRKVKDTK